MTNHRQKFQRPSLSETHSHLTLSALFISVSAEVQGPFLARLPIKWSAPEQKSGPSGRERWQGILEIDCDSDPNALSQTLAMPFSMWAWRFYFPRPGSWFVTGVGQKKVLEVLHTSSKPRPHKDLFVSMLSRLKPCHYSEALASLLKAPTPWGAELRHPGQGRPRSGTIQQTSRHERTPPNPPKLPNPDC